MDHNVYETSSGSVGNAVRRVLLESNLVEKIPQKSLIIIKPNLVEALDPPVTTPVQLVDELIGFLQEQRTDCEIVVGEGTGAIEYNTFHCFDHLGYSVMAGKRSVELLDLNEQSLTKKENSALKRLPELFLPQILDEAFLLSVPVLKAHSMAGVTLTMKNMMGCVPPSHYRQGNSWGKSAFHFKIQEAISDLNRYRTPDYTLLDASIGMAESHLWGAHCDPPIGKLVGSWDPVAIDSYGSGLLGRRWEEIGHIQLVHNHLGVASPLNVIEL